jgi:hypothetical protein
MLARLSRMSLLFVMVLGNKKIKIRKFMCFNAIHVREDN